MSDEATARFELPMLVPGQAQKEMTHNEALTVLDLLVQLQVEAVGVTTPPSSPLPGASWVVGDEADGAWAGKAGAVAGYTAGGWRFVMPREGMMAWARDPGCLVRYADGGWVVGAPLGPPLAAIVAPSGGSVVDPEARTAISAILAVLHHFGLTAG